MVSYRVIEGKSMKVRNSITPQGEKLTNVKLGNQWIKMVTRMTDKILPNAKEWQNRQLEPMYPIIYLDGIVFNMNQKAR